MNLQSRRLLPVAIIALIFGSATTLWADHHWDDDHDGDTTVAAHDPNGGEWLTSSHVQRNDVSDGPSAGDSHPVVPAQPGSGDDQDDCGLVIKEGDTIEVDNVPCIEPVLLERSGSSVPNR